MKRSKAAAGQSGLRLPFYCPDFEIDNGAKSSLSFPSWFVSSTAIMECFGPPALYTNCIIYPLIFFLL